MLLLEKMLFEWRKRHAPELILMDIVLKGEMDGVTAAEQIHERLDIPVIYLTGLTGDQITERAKITEPFGYILKPFQERELHTVIEIALYRHMMERKLEEKDEVLKHKLDEVERMNRLMVGREIRMEELRKRMRGLEEELKGLKNSAINGGDSSTVRKLSFIQLARPIPASSAGQALRMGTPRL